MEYSIKHFYWLTNYIKILDICLKLLAELIKFGYDINTFLKFNFYLLQNNVKINMMTSKSTDIL